MGGKKGSVWQGLWPSAGLQKVSIREVRPTVQKNCMKILIVIIFCLVCLL